MHNCHELIVKYKVHHYENQNCKLGDTAFILDKKKRRKLAAENERYDADSLTDKIPVEQRTHGGIMRKKPGQIEESQQYDCNGKKQAGQY